MMITLPIEPFLVAIVMMIAGGFIAGEGWPGAFMVAFGGAFGYVLACGIMAIGGVL